MLHHPKKKKIRKSTTALIIESALPDFIGIWQIHVFDIVSNGEHSHPQTLVFYVVLLSLWIGHPQWNHALLKVMLTLHKTKQDSFTHQLQTVTAKSVEGNILNKLVYTCSPKSLNGPRTVCYVPILLMYILSPPFSSFWGCKWKQKLSNILVIHQILISWWKKRYLINFIHGCCIFCMSVNTVNCSHCVSPCIMLEFRVCGCTVTKGIKINKYDWNWIRH